MNSTLLALSPVAIVEVLGIGQCLFFDISHDEAAASGLEGSDARTVGAELELAYEINHRRNVELDVGYDRLLGDAAESRPNQLEASIFLERSFALWR